MRVEPFEVRTRDGPRLRGESAGEGPPVVLVHGLGFSRRRWEAQVAAVAASGRRAVTFDLRGFGESELPPRACAMSDLVSDLDAVRAALRLDAIHLVGHSLGGMVALAYALDHPDVVRSLVVCSTSCHNGRRASALGEVMARLAAEGAETALSDGAFRAHVETLARSVLPYVATDAFLPILTRLAPRPDPARAFAWQATVGFSVRHRLHELRCPAMVVHGSGDPLMPYAAGLLLHLGIPGSRWVPVFEGGHNLPREQPDLFNEALVGFLEEVAGTR